MFGFFIFYFFWFPHIFFNIYLGSPRVVAERCSGKYYLLPERFDERGIWAAFISMKI